LMTPFAARHGLPALGAGIGLRFEHVERILAEPTDVPWFEVVSENYMNRGGLVRRHIREVASRWPVVCHGVSLNIGGNDPLDADYLARLKAFADEVRSPWVSDHLCFTAVDGTALNELLPLPRTEEAARHVAARVRQVQETLGRRTADGVRERASSTTRPRRERAAAGCCRTATGRRGCPRLPGGTWSAGSTSRPSGRRRRRRRREGPRGTRDGRWRRRDLP
ncbi:MAG TPA: DUF692 family protein, partial [Planctomycetota bacterium]|nr:DUF692 family protein [Planctomycetota bacterium]